MTDGPGVLFAPHAQNAMQRGIDRMAALVRPTLGPTPRCVAVAHMSPGHAPEVLDDAGTILRRVIQTANPYADMGAMLLRHALAETAQVVGDGTATTAVLMQAIVRHGMRAIENGCDPLALRRGLEQGREAAVAALRAMARPLDGRAGIRQCADTLCPDDELAAMLSEIFDIVGADGCVQIDGSYSRGLERQYVEGVYWQEGYLSPYFVTDAARQEARLEDAAVLISDLSFSSAGELAPLLDRLVQTGQRTLLVIASDVTDSALSTLVMNHQAGTLQAVAVKAPLSGAARAAVLEDIAVLTGGRRISAAQGVRAADVGPDDLGSARVAWASNRAFGLRGGGGDPRALRRRIADVKAALGRASADEAEQLRERLGMLTGGVAVLHVGAVSRVAGETRQAEARRTTLSLRRALEGGVVPGGGQAYLRCAAAVLRQTASPDEQVGLRVLAAALDAPLAALAQNAGHEPTTVVAQVKAASPHIGFDARSGELVDMWGAGILDPALVAQTVLAIAVSGATMALTTDVLVHRRNPRAVIDP